MSLADKILSNRELEAVDLIELVHALAHLPMYKRHAILWAARQLFETRKKEAEAANVQSP